LACANSSKASSQAYTYTLDAIPNAIHLTLQRGGAFFSYGRALLERGCVHG
jgi:hypothetical protein